MRKTATGKIVWMIGAGFSKSLGAPLLGELFSDAQLDRVLIRYGEIFDTKAVRQQLRSMKSLCNIPSWQQSMDIEHAARVENHYSGDYRDRPAGGLRI